MIRLEASELAALRELFPVDRLGPQIGLHAIATGTGSCWADRLPEPRAAVVQLGLDIALAGDPAALDAARLAALELRGFVEADDVFLPLLRETFRELTPWTRVTLRLRGREGPTAAPADIVLRRLEPGDATLLADLDTRLQWISLPYGGRLVSVALPFTAGVRVEDLGVVTEEGFRDRGLSTACAARLLSDVESRGRVASWTTSPDNAASLAVARHLGAEPARKYALQVTGVNVPSG